MNLTVDPWIPALQACGRRELFSLREIFVQARELRDLSAKPHERIALMRLLICITQAALDGPADESGWEACEPLIQPLVKDYLDKWGHAFELFGDGPRFMQLPNLRPLSKAGEGKAATKLDIALATGNNSTLFDNCAGQDRAFAPARSALNLLAFQNFAPGGRIGVAKWNGKVTPGEGASNHAPCASSSMVHSLVLGRTLLDTLRRNLLTRELSGKFHGRDRWGKPVWEQPVERAEDHAAIENTSATYLGRLAPVSRAVRLGGDGLTIILANGLDYPSFPKFREATATIIQRKDELSLLPASTNRSHWRQLAAISIARRADADAVCGPLALNHPTTAFETTLWVGALVTDKSKIEDVVESIYELPSNMFTESGRIAYGNGVAYAEEREGSLIKAVKTYASLLRLAAPACERARLHFWTGVEQKLSLLFDLARNPDLAGDLPNSPWGRAVRSAAFAAYDHSCPRQTPRQIQACALGLRKLSFVSKQVQATVDPP